MEIFISGTEIDSNYIIQNPTQLVSFRSGESYQWFMNDEPIEGATARTLPYNDEKAVFFVVVFRNGCNRKSSVIDFTNAVIEINKDDAATGINIGPNPLSQELILEIPIDLPGAVSFKLFDAQGRVVRHERIANKGMSKYSVVDLADGVYYMKLQIGDQEYAKTLVKL